MGLYQDVRCQVNRIVRMYVRMRVCEYAHGLRYVCVGGRYSGMCVLGGGTQVCVCLGGAAFNYALKYVCVIQTCSVSSICVCVCLCVCVRVCD